MTETLHGLDGEIAEDPTVQIQEDIAEQLAALSNETEAPTDVEVPGSPFTRDEVDFNSDAWMACVSSVRGWLRLEGLVATGTVDDFVQSLSLALNFEDVGHAIEHSAGFPRLTAVALDRLRERTERAARIQRAFVDEFLSDGGTRESATRLWSNLWDEDEEEDEGASPEPVSAQAKTWRIENFVVEARDGKLNLTPSYQRGDVWGTSARQMLIESVLRGIPLPSVILLKSSDPASQSYEVVDGKQRLTSILRFVGKHPLAVETVRQAHVEHPEGDLFNLFTTDYPKFKRAWKGIFNEPLTSSLEEHYYFPFRLRTDDRGLPGAELAPLRGKYYTQIKQLLIHVADEQVPVEYVFERSTEYNIPVIIYNRASQRQIHEVFNLYNKQGTHLNAEEIRNAIFHELELTRATLVAAGDSDPRTPVSTIAPALVSSWERIEPLQDTLRGYGFGDSRYRRTKVLFWVIATLLMEGRGDKLPSTAKHIDSLLQRVQANRQDPLRDGETVRELFEWIARSAEAHAGYAEAWAPTFKDGDAGGKWQELQLVGSLVGVAIATAEYGDDIDHRLAEAATNIYAASEGWTRPEKTQTSTQWEFISRVARGVAGELGIDATAASASVKSRFGTTGVDSLWSVTADDASG